MKRGLLGFGVGLLCAGLFWAGPLAATHARAKVLRLATLAPRNSTWMKFFRKMAREVKKKTGGALRLKFYPDGVMGDEALVVEKMRLKQLDGAAITNVGLGKIQPAMLVQQAPMLFRNYKEVDCLREKMNARFTALLEEKGYRPLGYGDVGFVYTFGNKELRTPEDYQGAKVWAWTDDPVGLELQKQASIATVPLGVPEVLASLQTGSIDTFYTAPYAAIALQWFMHAKFIVNMKVAMGVGATVLRKESWDALSEEHRATLLAVAEKWTKRLNRTLRRDNRNAVKTLTGTHGMQIVKLTKAERARWRKIASATRRALVGSLYSQELLDEVKATLKACRSGG
jgi:TRAP-type C4-dicarboxylate transport system substrate-binding protein